MEKKFTQKEFIERHVEFLKNYSTKYRFQDLDFRSVMGMSGCDDDEFREHMEEMWAARSQTQSTRNVHWNEDWGDGEDDDDYYDSSRGRRKDDGGDDANEY